MNNKRVLKRCRRMAHELAKGYLPGHPNQLIEDAIRDIAAAMRFVTRRRNASITIFELREIALQLERKRVRTARKHGIPPGLENWIDPAVLPIIRRQFKSKPTAECNANAAPGSRRVRRVA